MSEEFPSPIESETLADLLARPEVTPEMYAAIRTLHKSGRSPDETAMKIWTLVRGFRPPVHVGKIREQIQATREFPVDTFGEVKLALRHLEAGLAEFANHAVKRLILRPRREKLVQALTAAPKPPAMLAQRVDAALAASG